MVTGCDGTEVTDLALSVGLARVDLDPTGTVKEVVSTSAADSGTAMRWADTHYQFNLSTKRSQFNAGQDLVSGGYRLTISDGSFATPVVAYFDLRR